MNHESSEADIEKLLSGLRNSDVYLRNLAVESIGKQKVTDERIIGALKSIASRDTNEYVKKAAIMILINSGILSPILEDDPNFSRKRGIMSNDLWVGVVLFFGLNIIMGLFIFIFAGILPPLLSSTLNFLPFVINIGLMIYYAVTNRAQTALGMLTGFGAALAVVVCLGLIFTAACFVILGSYQ